jgi:hypothetical protein
MTHMQNLEADALEASYPPVIDTEVAFDENASHSQFLVGALGNVDDALLADGYDQMLLGQAHASRSLDLIRLCDPLTARYLMVMNAKLWLEQARAVTV